MKKKKLFVFDTNVMLNDPNCIYSFDNNDIAIPIVALEELDHLRKGDNSINENARIITKKIDDLIGNKSLSDNIGSDLGNSCKYRSNCACKPI